MLPLQAFASNFDVPNIQVTVQAKDAVQARDQAITQAQRQALAVLVGRTVDKMTTITDDQIARLVSNFSVQGEHLTATSYAATFTIRFEPNRTQSFIQAHGFDLVDAGTVANGSSTTITPAQQTAYVPENLVILPVLDIGSRHVLWDEPNPWRDVWQKTDHSIKGMTLRVPMGDITDIADVPDAGFLGGKPINNTDLLARYSAKKVYAVVAKNQGAALDTSSGITLSIYRFEDDQLRFVRKMMLHPRAGHAFDDAVPQAVQMIVMSENNASDEDNTATTEDTKPSDLPAVAPIEEKPQIPAASVEGLAEQDLVVTVPYQTLGEWVSIQRRLRGVPGVKTLVTMRVSPASAEVRIIASADITQLTESLRSNGFALQTMPNGENALIQQ
jgi:hypothetical protein